MGVAGAVMEKTSGQVISEYARDTFFEPMGLDASFDAKYLSDKSLVANCYAGSTLKKDNKYLTRSQPWGGAGETFHLTAGGLLISAEDLASLFTILVNNGQYDGKQYISKDSLNNMLSKQLEPKGFTQCIGIRKQENLVGSRTMYYHNGEAYGIHSLMALDMSDKSGVIVITSGASAVRNDNTIFAVCDDVLNYCYSNVIEK
jgi:CubicO group peptidase (beta-lactamase class C family)